MLPGFYFKLGEPDQSDADIAEVCGDHDRYSIKLWREELASGETSLHYADWRADKLWCEADASGSQV